MNKKKQKNFVYSLPLARVPPQAQGNGNGNKLSESFFGSFCLLCPHENPKNAAPLIRHCEPLRGNPEVQTQLLVPSRWIATQGLAMTTV